MDEDERLNRSIKGLERWHLLRALLPMLCLAPSLTVLYAWIGLTTSVNEVFYALPLFGASLLCAVAGLRARIRNWRAAGDPTTAGYGLILLSWAFLITGMAGPWYLT